MTTIPVPGELVHPVDVGRPATAVTPWWRTRPAVAAAAGGGLLVLGGG